MSVPDIQVEVIRRPRVAFKVSRGIIGSLQDVLGRLVDGGASLRQACEVSRNFGLDSWAQSSPKWIFVLRIHMLCRYIEYPKLERVVQLKNEILKVR